MAAPEREFVSSRNEDDGHAWAYSRTRDAEMADLRPALMGWAKIAPALRAFRPQKVHRTFCRAVPEPVLTVENARKGAKPFLALFAPGICSAVATRSAGKCGTWKERMLLSENRCPLFRNMRVSETILDPTQLIVKSSPRPSLSHKDYRLS